MASRYLDYVVGAIMIKCYYRGRMHTVNELSEMSGIAPATIRYRLRKGYSVDEAVKMAATNDSVYQFTEASWWEDWIGMPISDLYEIYWRWCIQHGYTVLQLQGFSRQLFQMFPNLKTVPSRVDGKCLRIIREKDLT